MSETAEILERELLRDLTDLGDRFADEEFCSELYRALAGAAWRKQGGSEGHLALSWTRAERLVNELRARHGASELTLAQTGGEGDVSDVVADELARLGWQAEPRERRDAGHLAEPESPPPPDQAGPADWEEQAHEEADAQLRQHPRGGTSRQLD